MHQIENDDNNTLLFLYFEISDFAVGAGGGGQELFVLDASRLPGWRGIFGAVEMSHDVFDTAILRLGYLGESRTD